MVVFGLLACQQERTWGPEWMEGTVIRSVKAQDCGEGHVIAIEGTEYFSLSPILALLKREFPLCEDAPCLKIPVRLRAIPIKSSCPGYKNMVTVLEIKFR